MIALALTFAAAPVLAAEALSCDGTITAKTTLADLEKAYGKKNVKTGPFVHPVDLGGLAEKHKCDFCHQANKTFKHPINLGDISMFQCVECHPRTRAAPEAGNK